MTTDPKEPKIHLVKPAQGGADILATSRTSERFARKKDAIVSAATGILNRRGVKGMTLADVAASVDLSTTSVTYYFKKKEDLAVACFLRGIEWFEALTSAAFTDPDPRKRLKRFIELYLDSNRRIREGEEPPIALFNDIRALKEPYLSIVLEPYNALFRKVRTLFHGPGSTLSRQAANARTHALMEQIYWSVSWLPRYHVEDYPRIAARLFDISNNGLAPEGARWQPVSLASAYHTPQSAAEHQRETFLIAATKLINLRGYRGASVEKISAQLNVTKGSFYHHNDAKDDLVIACFERTFDVIRRVQSAAMQESGDEWHRLCSAAATLAEYQVSEHGPLLRASALSALPETIRYDMIARWTRVSDRFAAMISDGVAQGSVRPVDPVIAAQLLNAALNAAASMTMAVPGAPPSDAATLYAKPFLMGMFSE
jgi:AcrR family transcriptional regulator